MSCSFNSGSCIINSFLCFFLFSLFYLFIIYYIIFFEEEKKNDSIINNAASNQIICKIHIVFQIEQHQWKC